MSSTSTEVRVTESYQSAPRASAAVVWLVVLSLIVVSAVLRLHRLGDWSFWVDEMFTLIDISGPSWQYRVGTYPLSYLMIGATIQAFGVSEWTARIVPAIVGVLTPVMVYLLARRSFGELPSIIAAGIVALSPWHLYWSQMARFYTLTVFFSTASLLVVYRGIEEDRRWYIASAGLLMVLATLSHYSALLIMIAIAGYVGALLVLRCPRPRGLNLVNALLFLAPFIIGGVLLSPKAGALLHKYLVESHPTGTNLANPLKAGVYMIASMAYRLELTVALLAFVGIVSGLVRRDRATLALACGVVVPTLALIIFGMMGHAENRYGFVVLPAAALLAGLVVADISRRLWQHSRALAVVVPVLVVLPLTQHDMAYFGSMSNGERWNYRAAADYIRAHAKPGDTAYTSMPYPLQYYLKGSGIEVADLSSSMKEGRIDRGWFVMEDFTRGQSASRSTQPWLEENCRLTAHFPASSPVTNYGLSVYLLEK